jgi:hypothetical protein
LQLLEECQGAPFSVEWTVPFRQTFFHLGVHNLPPSQARAIFAEMDQCRSSPNEQLVRRSLREIANSPETLVIFNHPLWDENHIGQARHDLLAREFLGIFGDSLHALEINGLRPWRENRQVLTLAREVQKPAISGGDRHALEPNTIINRTNAGTFSEFVEEVRAGWSDVLVLRQYREPFPTRILHNLIDVLRTYDHHANGWRLWSDRVFYSCDDGEIRSLTQVFGKKLPIPIALFVGTIQFVSTSYVRRLLRGAFPPTEEVRL